MSTDKYAGAFGDESGGRSFKADQTKTLVSIKPARALFAFIAGVYIATRLWGITTYSIWGDSIFSVRAARLGWNAMIDFVVRDVVHPPLFYLLLKLWIMIGGETTPWLTLFPVLTSIAAIGPFLLLCRELKLRAAEINLALLLMAVNGYLISNAQEIRMYSLLLFLSLCSLWLFVRFFNAEGKARRPLLELSAVNLLLVYTQYYGWTVVGTQLIFLLLWGRRKLPSFAVSVAVLSLCFSPWAVAAARAALSKGGLNQNLAWNKKPRLVDLATYYAYLNGALNFRWSTFVRLFLFGSPVALWAWHVIRGRGGKGEARGVTFWSLILFFFPLIALIFLVSQVLPYPIWAFRYLIIGAVPYTLLVSIAVLRLRPAWVRSLAVFAIVGWAAASGFKYLSSPFKFSWEALVNKMAQTESTATGVVRVYVSQNGMGGAIKFYLEAIGERKYEVLQVSDAVEMAGDHFWVGGYGGRPDYGVWSARGYRVGETFSDENGAFLFPVWRH